MQDNARTSWGGFQQNLHKISSQGPGPDHVRTPSGFHQDIFKSFSCGPAQDHAKAFDSMSLGSPQDLRTRTCTRLWARSPLQDPFENLTGSSNLTRSWYKSLLSYKHLYNMASASSSCQDLLERISPGSPQDLLLEEAVHARIYDEHVCPGTSTDVLCEPAQSKGTCTSHKSHCLCENFTGKIPGPKIKKKSGAERNAHGHVTRAICRRPESVPWSNPGLNTYRKNPSMWTDCLGKNCLVDWQGSKNWGSMGHNFPQ